MSTDTQAIPEWALNVARRAYADSPIKVIGAMEAGALVRQFAKAIHDAVMAERPKLQPIATAPRLERVMVAGWNPPSGAVAGYWWYEEDCVDDGKAIDKPYATHWFPIVKPVFPAAPKLEG